MFHKRLMGIKGETFGVFVTQTDEENWMCNRGINYQLVNAELCISSDGVSYWPIGDMVFGSDGSQFMPIDDAEDDQ